MSNKTQLQENNTALDGYIARINAAKEVAAGLPEAGGSSDGSSNITSEWIPFSSLPTTYGYGDGGVVYQNVYLELSNNISGFIIGILSGGVMQWAHVAYREDNLGNYDTTALADTTNSIQVNSTPVESGDDYNIFEIGIKTGVDVSNYYYLPIYYEV